MQEPDRFGHIVAEVSGLFIGYWHPRSSKDCLKVPGGFLGDHHSQSMLCNPFGAWESRHLLAG